MYTPTPCPIFYLGPNVNPTDIKSIHAKSSISVGRCNVAAANGVTDGDMGDREAIGHAGMYKGSCDVSRTYNV